MEDVSDSKNLGERTTEAFSISGRETLSNDSLIQLLLSQF